MSAAEGGVLELTTDLTRFTFAKMKQTVSCLYCAASLAAYTHGLKKASDLWILYRV